MIDFLKQLVNQAPFVQGGVALLLAGWLGYQARALPERVWDLVRAWTTRVIHIRDTHPHYEAWLTMLTEHSVRKGGPRTLEVRVQCDADGNRLPAPRLAAGTAQFWARLGGKWCHVCVLRDEANPKTGLVPRFMIVVEVAWGTRVQITRMVEEAGRRAVYAEERQVVGLYGRHGLSSTIRIPKRDPRTLCLPRGLFESVETRLREFLGARERYEGTGIPWRFGVLLSGPPGTGKTSLTHALASRLGLRIAVITLADLESDQELVEVFRGVEDQALILIEDIDCAFRQRDGGGDAAAGVSFSGFLNCIDGVLAPHNGRVLVMSTNHVERLDPALIRPGRVDLHLEIPLLERQDAADYADRVFPHVAARHDVVDEVMACAHPTPALLINRLTRERWHRTTPAPTPQREAAAT
ncbi:hypothetical protein BH11PLA1_BH11PLA1_03110 [soil metagenome]